VLPRSLGTHGRFPSIHSFTYPISLEMVGRTSHQIVTRPGWGIGRLSAPPEFEARFRPDPDASLHAPSSKDLIASFRPAGCGAANLFSGSWQPATSTNAAEGLLDLLR